MGRRVTGVGSSPALPIKEKTKLWNKLRKLDRKIGILDRELRRDFMFIIQGEFEKEDKRDKLDKKRKYIRLKLKGYNNEKNKG